MALRMTTKQGENILLWEMFPDQEYRYRQEWAQRHTKRQTEGSYCFQPLTVNGLRYAGKLRGTDFRIRFGDTPESFEFIGEGNKL